MRTVQRYEREMGLPVRRPAGKSRAAVVATKAELDAWVDASPYRNTLSLARPSPESAVFADNIVRGVKEMQRLSEEMRGLRNEVTKSVAVLRESIRSVQAETHPALRRATSFSIADFDSNNKAVFDLLGTRFNGKVS